MPLISICIPVYKNIDYVKRLLNSISTQTFKDVEVIITDDSLDESIEPLIADYKPVLKIEYFKNNIALGTPANWNFAISKAKGEWIKIMHDDDWFTTDQSLEILISHIKKGYKIIKSAYINIFENGKKETVFMNGVWKKRVLKQPMCLMANNIIGPPSVLLIHSSIKEKYDERLKWRVDQEFYVRLLKSEDNFRYIKDSLINVGISNKQVTNSCIYNPKVELPEGLILLQKHGVEPLKNIWVYDAWWRLLRNMNIISVKQLYNCDKELWPTVIIKMVNHLNRTPKAFLKTGVLSKICMLLSYLFNLSNLND